MCLVRVRGKMEGSRRTNPTGRGRDNPDDEWNGMERANVARSKDENLVSKSGHRTRGMELRNLQQLEDAKNKVATKNTVRQGSRRKEKKKGSAAWVLGLGPGRESRVRSNRSTARTTAILPYGPGLVSILP